MYLSEQWLLIIKSGKPVTLHLGLFMHMTSSYDNMNLSTSSGLDSTWLKIFKRQGLPNAFHIVNFHLLSIINIRVKTTVVFAMSHSKISEEANKIQYIKFAGNESDLVSWHSLWMPPPTVWVCGCVHSLEVIFSGCWNRCLYVQYVGHHA